MVLDIVRQAVEIKLNSQTESPLISEAEYCCACGIGLRKAGREELVDQAKNSETIEELRKEFEEIFQNAFQQQKEGSREYRLFHLLLHTRVEGRITDEIRVLFG